MPDIFDNMQSAMQALRERLSVTTAYGEPVSANGITVIPVSRVRFGFGGGAKARQPGGGFVEGAEDSGEGGSSTGGGMGGGGSVDPIGYIEISDAGSRWVPLEPPRGEVVLRVLAIVPAFVPLGKRGGGVLRRLFLLAAGQAIVGAALRRRLGGGAPFRLLGRVGERAA